MQSLEVSQESEQVAEDEFAINLYPLLGLALVLGAAVLVYGAFFFV